MTLVEYLKDKLIFIVISIISYILISLILGVCGLPITMIILILSIIIIPLIIVLLYDFNNKKQVYKSIDDILNGLDKKYLLPEIIEEPDFYEGKTLYEILSITNKSMHEEVNKYKFLQEEYREYIEMWVHEIKTPIASSKLLIENNKDKVTLSILEDLEKIEAFIEQALYYSRSNNVEKDYIVKEFPIIDSINNVIRKNKRYFREKKVGVLVDEEINSTVFSDTKWVEFILNQVIINAIKYGKDKNGIVKIYTKENENSLKLYIEDNGIGINEKDIAKVFEKGFTGSNGRNNEKSTGMGLYLSKKLCNKLSLGITIQSEINTYTKVEITFPKSKFILLES